MRISNLTTDRRFAIFVAEKICSLKVSGLHFYDVISDNLDEFADSFEAIARQL